MRCGTGLKGMIGRAVVVWAVVLTAVGGLGGSGACGEITGIRTPTHAILPVVENIVEGRAPADGGDDALAARQKAIENAQHQALLDGVRPLIHPVIFVRETDYLIKVLERVKNEAIREAEVVSESREEDGVYRIVMRSLVKRTVLEDALLGNLPSRKVIVNVSDISSAGRGRGHILRNELGAHLRKKGYEMVDPRLQGDAASRRLFSLLRAGDREAQKLLGLYLLAATIMEGSLHAAYSQETSGIFSARAYGSMRAYKAAGRTPASFAVQGVKGFGGDKASSVSDAMHKAAAILSQKAVKPLPGRRIKK